MLVAISIPLLEYLWYLKKTRNSTFSTGQWILTLDILRPWRPRISTVWFSMTWTCCRRMTASSTPAPLSLATSPSPSTSSNMCFPIKVQTLGTSPRNNVQSVSFRNIRRRVCHAPGSIQKSERVLKSVLGLGRGGRRHVETYQDEQNENTAIQRRYIEVSYVYVFILKFICIW